MKLKMENISFCFGEKQILKDLSLQVKEGEFISILGPSGCGKSTILNLLAGLLEPRSGAIYVDETKIQGISSHFAYMPQEDLLLPWNTILDNVCLSARVHGSKKKVIEEAKEKLIQFGLEGYEHAYPEELSGGMRQRAAFLRTAMCVADILLLDEPFGALDVITRNDLQDWLKDMRYKLNKTTILVTHDIDEALYLSDRIFILSKSMGEIHQVIDLSKEKKSRRWLYEQSELRTSIYQLLKGENHVA